MNRRQAVSLAFLALGTPALCQSTSTHQLDSLKTVTEENLLSLVPINSLKMRLWKRDTSELYPEAGNLKSLHITMFYKSSNSLNEELEIIFFKLHNGIYTGGRSYFYQNSTGIGSKSIVEFLPIVGEIRNAADASKKFGERVDSGGLDKEGSGELMYDRGDLVYVFKFDKQTVVGWRVTVR